VTGAGLRIALYGGSFDPPHVAHVLAATWVLSAAPVDALWVLPVGQHVFGKVAAAPFEARLALCRLAFGLLGERVQVRADEQRPDASGRTLDLVRHLQHLHPRTSFRLVIGSDALAERDRWHDFTTLAQLAPPLVLPRPGHPVDAEFVQVAAPVLLPDVSSTQVRALLKNGEDPGGLLPLAVRAAIVQRHLYV